MSNFFCSLCNVNLSDENMLQIHLGTVQHQTMLNQQQQQQQQQQHQGMEAETTTVSPYACELCDTKCTSEEMFAMHINGAKHAKKVREADFQRKKEVKDPEVYCQLCDLLLHPELMRAHRQGMKHLSALKASGDPEAAALIQSKKKKVAGAKAMKSVMTKGAPSLTPMMPPESGYSQVLGKKMSKDEVQKLVSKRHHMKCSVCAGPDFTTFSQAEHHFNSKAHRLAYQQHQQEMIKSKGKHCEVCNVMVSSDELLEAHKKGYKHTLRSSGGQIPPGHAYYEKFLKHQETMKNLRASKSAAAAASASAGASV